jgi:hypothetical protein
MADLAPLPSSPIIDARDRRLVAMRLQQIEGNAVTAEDVAIFEMFERQAWTHERRLSYILAQARLRAAE